MKLIIGTRLDGFGRLRVSLLAILLLLMMFFCWWDWSANARSNAMSLSDLFVVYAIFTLVPSLVFWLVTGLIGWIYRGFERDINKPLLED